MKNKTHTNPHLSKEELESLVESAVNKVKLSGKEIQKTYEEFFGETPIEGHIQLVFLSIENTAQDAFEINLN